MSAGKPLDPQLIEFLRARIQLAGDMYETAEMSRQQGYSDDAIRAGIEVARPLGDALECGVIPPPPLVTRAPANLRNIGAPKLDLYTLEGFLKPKECARIIALVSHHLQPSALSYAGADDTFRISTT